MTVLISSGVDGYTLCAHGLLVWPFHSEEKEVSMTLHPQTCANKIDAQD
jgi:hypothetical protein